MNILLDNHAAAEGNVATAQSFTFIDSYWSLETKHHLMVVKETVFKSDNGLQWASLTRCALSNLTSLLLIAH